MASTVLRFGLIAFALLALFQLSKYALFIPSFPGELWMALFALLFLAMGFILSRQIMKPVVVVEETPPDLDFDKVDELGISRREYEVLVEVAHCLSNREIAENLFVSESTVKSHVSSLLSKLGAERRTQAVTLAKKLNIIE